MIWNRTKKCDSWGRNHQQDRPEADWIRRDAPALRIVSADQWEAAHRRLTEIREHLKASSGGALGQRSRNVESGYLLPGFAGCAVCGGGLGVIGGSHTSAKGHVYGCLAYHKRGTSICGNNLKLPMDRIDQAVLKAAAKMLRPAVVDALVDGFLAAIRPRAIAAAWTP